MNSPNQTHPSTVPQKNAQELLATELAAFERELPRLLSEGEDGRWVVIGGDEIAGLWDTFDDAIQAGYARFLTQPFLVQEVFSELRNARRPTQRTSSFSRPQRGRRD
jgi:hypothetical protein